MEGFTIPNIDEVLAPYVKKTWISYFEYMDGTGTDCPADDFADDLTWKDLVQGIESIEHSLHMINNTFITFSFGLDTSRWGQLVTKAILHVREKGLGTKGIPAVFPKLVFLHREELHGEGAELEYLFLDAVKTSSKCMYPDFLSLDEGYLGDVYDRTGKAISPMGQSAHLKPCERY